jgi:hypothetical protein
MTPRLAATQRRMQVLITDPGAGEHPASGDLVRGTSRLPAAERLALYQRAYRLRLLGCLRESYPALRHALTAELFDAFALEYLAAQPPRSYTLSALGAGWPEHLERNRPDRDAPADEREWWLDFVVDLARVERLFCEVYDAAGSEQRAQPTAADLPAEPDGAWLGATVAAPDCLRLLRARADVAPYMLAVRRGDDPPLPPPGESFVALSRRNYDVTLTELDGAGFALLHVLMRGASIGAAARAAALDPGTAWVRLREWVECGLFSAIVAPAAARSDVRFTKGVAR